MRIFAIVFYCLLLYFKVVGVARRVELVEELASELKDEPGKLYPFKCDVTVEEEMINTFKWANENLGPVHVMVNNAGI